MTTCGETDDNFEKWNIPPSPRPHPVWITRPIDDNVMKPMTMLWNQWQCRDTDDNVMTPMTTCGETDDNVMKPTTMLWHRWQCCCENSEAYENTRRLINQSVGNYIYSIYIYSGQDNLFSLKASAPLLQATPSHKGWTNIKQHLVHWNVLWCILLLREEVVNKFDLEHGNQLGIIARDDAHSASLVLLPFVPDDYATMPSFHLQS